MNWIWIVADSVMNLSMKFVLSIYGAGRRGLCVRDFVLIVYGDERRGCWWIKLSFYHAVFFWKQFSYFLRSFFFHKFLIFFFSDRTWNQLLYDFLYLYIFVLWIRVLVCFIFSSLVKCICGFVKVMTLWMFSWNGILIIHFAFTLCSLFCHASQIIAVFVSFIRCFLLEHKLNFYCYCLTDLSASC